VPPTSRAASDTICFNCCHTGHFSQECSGPRKNTARGHINHPPHGQQKVVTTKAGRVNYTAMENILESEHVLAGMFSLNGHPIIILFDSGATHDFISKTCTQRYQLTIESIKTPYMIRTTGGNVITKQVVMNAPLNLAGKIYKTHLIVLYGQGIDVILRMSWMKEHRALGHRFPHRAVAFSRTWCCGYSTSITVHDKSSSAPYHCSKS
jgi:hypothetical protein